MLSPIGSPVLHTEQQRCSLTLVSSYWNIFFWGGGGKSFIYFSYIFCLGVWGTALPRNFALAQLYQNYTWSISIRAWQKEKGSFGMFVRWLWRALHQEWRREFMLHLNESHFKNGAVEVSGRLLELYQGLWEWKVYLKKPGEYGWQPRCISYQRM